MKSKLFLFTTAALLILSSCSNFYVAFYSVGLTSVESPANAKEQFGETKVVTFEDDGVSKYRYEDDFIDITWFVDSEQFNFTLKNKSDHAIRINWDAVSYVDINGKARRVMHAGVNYSERNNSQPSTTIPKGASLSDILLPTDNVYYVSSKHGGWWEENYLLPSIFKTETIKTLPQTIIGCKMSIMMPIIIENIQNDYTFTFNVEKVLGNEVLVL